MAFVVMAVSVAVASFATYLGWRTWYLDTPDLRSLLFFRECELLRRTVLVEASEDRHEVLLLTFALPNGSSHLGLDLSIGEHIKVRSNRLLPLARSYSPVAARLNEFDLIVKVYPPTRGGPTPAHVSHLLSTLEVGDCAQISGPYPPPFQHIERDDGKKVGVLAFGVGITETLGVIRGLPDSTEEIVLLWAMRDRTELYAEEQLSELQKYWQGKLSVEYYVSQEAGRRMDASTLQKTFPWMDGRAEDQRFLAVGTKAMNKAAYAMVDEAGIPYRKLLTKRFGPRRRPAVQPLNSGSETVSDSNSEL